MYAGSVGHESRWGHLGSVFCYIKETAQTTVCGEKNGKMLASFNRQYEALVVNHPNTKHETDTARADLVIQGT